MLRKKLDHGFPQSDWDAAKDEARAMMISIARRKRTISYSELVAEIRAIKLAPHDPRLFQFLGEIASDEDDAGRGLLTVVVVHKGGDLNPGKGFFDLARSRGKDARDETAFWASELNRVHAYWSDH